MPFCRSCGLPFQWGFCDGRWVLLEPVETHEDLDRTYVDERGELRADHRDRCSGSTVNVKRLERKVTVHELQSGIPDYPDLVFSHEDGSVR